MIFFRPPTAAQRRAFRQLADGLEEIAGKLPAEMRFRFSRTRSDVTLDVPARSSAHRRLIVSASPKSFEYELGQIWSEPAPLTENVVPEILAACDAVIDGRVREIRDLRTRILYHIYMLRSRGLHKFFQDGQYSLASLAHLKVRRVRIRRLPPLSTV